MTMPSEMACSICGAKPATRFIVGEMDQDLPGANSVRQAYYACDSCVPDGVLVHEEFIAYDGSGPRA